MNATIQLTKIGTEDSAFVLGSRDALITLLHQAFMEVPTFKSTCTEALLTFDTKAAAVMTSLSEEKHSDNPLYDDDKAKSNLVKASYNVFSDFNIPKGYNYFVINRFGQGFAFCERPIKTEDGWVSNTGYDLIYGDKAGEGMYVGHGFDPIRWNDQIIKRAMDGKPAVKIRLR